jgi:hypothetical protein
MLLLLALYQRRIIGWVLLERRTVGIVWDPISPQTYAIAPEHHQHAAQVYAQPYTTQPYTNINWLGAARAADSWHSLGLFPDSEIALSHSVHMTMEKDLSSPPPADQPTPPQHHAGEEPPKERQRPWSSLVISSNCSIHVQATHFDVKRVGSLMNLVSSKWETPLEMHPSSHQKDLSSPPPADQPTPPQHHAGEVISSNCSIHVQATHFDVKRVGSLMNLVSSKWM